MCSALTDLDTGTYLYIWDIYDAFGQPLSPCGVSDVEHHSIEAVNRWLLHAPTGTTATVRAVWADISGVRGYRPASVRVLRAVRDGTSECVVWRTGIEVTVRAREGPAVGDRDGFGGRS